MIYFIWIPYRNTNSTGVSGALEMGCGFAMLRNGGCVFPHGQHSMEQLCSDFPNTANVSSRKCLLAPRFAGMAKCVGVVDPSSSWALLLLFVTPSVGLLPLSAGFKAQLLSLQSQRRWVCRVPGAWLRSGAAGQWQSTAQAPVPALP